MPDIALVIFLFVSSCLLTWAYRHLALRTNILDEPVFRSAHATPIPVGGGAVLVLLFFIFSLNYYFQGRLSFEELMSLLGAIFIGVVGLIDDLRELKIATRVCLQVIAAIWSVSWLGGVSEINLLGWNLQSAAILSGIAALGTVWLLNLYNFMDGIDGIATAELLFVASMSLFLMSKEGGGSASLLCLVLVASGAGFLVWNWAPAKIFMGDVGSSFLGFVLATIAIMSLNQGLTIWTWLILLAVFITDATLTLAKRFLNGEKWYQGHSTHAYQKAAKHFNSHSKVTITMTGINCLWLAPLAWGSVKLPDLGVVFTAIAVVPLIILATYFKAGQPNS